jgi:ribokinase
MAEQHSERSAPAVAVSGSLMIDLVVRVPRRPRRGETVFGSEFGIFLGGKGFNQAVAARRLGATVAMIGRVGADDFGGRLRAALERERVDTRALVEDAEAGTGVALPMIDAQGDNSIVSVPRANLRLSPADIAAAAEQLDGCDALLLQMEVAVPATVAAARRARAAGARVLFNAAPQAPVPEELLEQAHVLVVNETEAEGLTGAAVPDVDAALVVAERLTAGGRRLAVVTLGARGAVLAGAGLREYLPAHVVSVRDSTGAGDAFCGALAVRLCERDDPRDALAWANAAGACAVTRDGAEPSLPERAAVLRQLKERG